MKKLILPAAVVLFGTGAAFATKMNNSKRILVPGYHINASTGRCVTDNQQCSTTPGDPCTWAVNPSIDLQASPLTPTMCGDELFKP
jgi:hypothetical protein